jgi:hypothetical protein
MKSERNSMKEQEFNELMNTSKKDLVMEIDRLRSRVAKIEAHNIEMGWRLNPDRMGGQFTQEEINRGTEWR